MLCSLYNYNGIECNESHCSPITTYYCWSEIMVHDITKDSIFCVYWKIKGTINTFETYLALHSNAAHICKTDTVKTKSAERWIALMNTVWFTQTPDATWFCVNSYGWCRKRNCMHKTATKNTPIYLFPNKLSISLQEMQFISFDYVAYITAAKRVVI